MSWSDEQEETLPARRTYTPAETAADQALYGKLKRSIGGRSLFLILPIALIVGYFSWIVGLALVAGGVCGVLNARLSMLGNEGLARSSNAGAFVLSSFLRIAVFGIVPVGFAARGPWWTIGVYFAGFFTPLALFAIGLQREYQRKS
ncbi:MAG: hypothetical protein M3Y21_09600 [Candidatus Eremiobacteraeota bacterium]|nr:hypothetical protein [Candidatus Eremiobacteraeota bacterium]